MEELRGSAVSYDWKAGDRIVIASTSFYHEEAEVFTIISASGNKMTLDRTPTFRHNGGEYTYGTEKFPMRAEVGLLTRNIVI